jgi:phosphocarrier protein HPr
MVKKRVKILNPTGLHLRPAGVLCDCAVKYSCHIIFNYKDGGEANCKSILSILGACIRFGDEIEFVCEGEDEDNALMEICALVENGFGEQ